MYRNYFYLIYLITYACCSLHAQKVEFSPVVEMGREEWYWLGVLEDKILVANKTKNAYKMNILDTALQIKAETDITFEQPNASLLKIFTDKNYYYIIYSYTKKNKVHVLLSKYTKEAELLKDTILGEFPDKFVFRSEQIEFSENKQKIALYANSLSETKALIVCDIPSFRVHYQQTMEWDSISYLKEFMELVINNTGAVFLIFDHKGIYRRQLKAHQLLIQRIDTNTQTVTHFAPCPDYFFHTFAGKYDERNQNLVISGFSAQKEAEVATHHFFYRTDMQQAQGVLQHTLLEEAFLRSFTGSKRKKILGITDMRVREILLKQDGGCLLIGEQVSIQKYQFASALVPAGGGGSNLSTQIDYMYGNLALFATHNTGQIHWKNIIHKYQKSENDGGAYSSFFLLKTPQALELIYNNEIDTETGHYQYTIRPNGQLERKILSLALPKSTLFEFKKSIQTQANEFLVPHFFARKLKIARFVY